MTNSTIENKPLTTDKWKRSEHESKSHFYIRSVPDELHSRWKLLASFMKVNMRDIALDAIDAYVAAKELEFKEVLKVARLGGGISK